jgi:uncharacterized damage-inducible protein DinB
MTRLIIDSNPPFGPELGRLVSMLTYVRETTFHACAGLKLEQLDTLYDAASNSIGALLSHIAAVESAYQVMSFESRLPSPEEEQGWGAALKLGDRGRAELRGHPLQFYIDRLEQVRSRTLRELQTRSDDWLDERVRLGTFEANHYWMWFHLMEDELNHRGQIRWLRSRLG